MNTLVSMLMWSLMWLFGGVQSVDAIKPFTVQQHVAGGGTPPIMCIEGVDCCKYVWYRGNDRSPEARASQMCYR